jgi:ABC-type sugar transport system permease subunit
MVRVHQGSGKKRSRELMVIAFLLTPAMLVFFVYRIVPIIWNMGLSLFEWVPTRSLKFVGLAHYEEMFIYDDVFRTALANTLIYMFSMPLVIALALLIAVLVNQPIGGRNFYRAAIFISYPMMPVAVGIIWQWMYNEKVGIINYALMSAGLIDAPIPFLSSSSLALPSVIIVSMWQIIGFFMIVLLTGLQSIPVSLYEAATIDGAGAARRFFRITVPLLRPSLFLCFVVGVISSFTSFDLIHVMTGGGPGHASELLITYVYKTAFVKSQFDYASALTVVMFALFLVITLVINRLSGGDAGKVDTAG